MTSPLGLATASAILVPLGTGLVPGCSGSGDTCDCPDTTITITVPADVASSVTAVNLTGAACTGLTATPKNQTNGGTAYAFAASAAGTCSIDVVFADGTTFDDELTILRQTGCCAGFVASPASAAQVQVPEPDASAGDAG
jgi:hypothetical protein